MDQYELRKTHIPPILVERDGVLYVQIIDGPLTILAPVGREFMKDVLQRLTDKVMNDA